MNNKSLSVTTIIPAYNAGKLISRTLASVIGQTYPTWKAIVVDDGSSDDTCDIVQSIAQKEERVSLLMLEKNYGAPSRPRNLGVAEADGDWIAFLDADDIWHPQKLELQINAILRSGARFCCTAMCDFTNETQNDNPVYFESLPTSKITFEDHRLKGRIPNSSVLVESALVRQFPFEEKLMYKAVEDYHCWLRILNSGETCLKIELPLLYYRRSPGQISGSKINMMKKIYMVHSQYKDTSSLQAAFFTSMHVIGGAYFRFFRGKL